MEWLHTKLALSIYIELVQNKCIKHALHGILANCLKYVNTVT